MPNPQINPCDLDLGIITSANITQLAVSECDDCDDCETVPGPSDCECSDCIGCIG